MHLQEYMLYVFSVCWALWNDPHLFVCFVPEKTTVTIMFSIILSTLLPVLPVLPFPQNSRKVQHCVFSSSWSVMYCMHAWESVLTGSQFSVSVFVDFSWNCWGSYCVFVSLILFGIIPHYDLSAPLINKTGVLWKTRRNSIRQCTLLYDKKN